METVCSALALVSFFAVFSSMFKPARYGAGVFFFLRERRNTHCELIPLVISYGSWQRKCFLYLVMRKKEFCKIMSDIIGDPVLSHSHDDFVP